MVNIEDSEYRLRLAREHLSDAEFELTGERWSKAAMSAQLAVENVAKAVIALVRPLPKARDLAAALMDVENAWREDSDRLAVAELAGLAQRLGQKERVLTSYGDELGYRTPSELYDEQKGRRAVDWSKRALILGQKLYQAWLRQHDDHDPPA